jgi:hypothetical protein
MIGVNFRKSPQRSVGGSTVHDGRKGQAETGTGYPAGRESVTAGSGAVVYREAV